MIFLIVLFFVLAAFFSGLETGFISLDTYDLEYKSSSCKKTKKILKYLKNPNSFLTTTLTGTNICIVVVTSLITYFLQKNKLIFFNHYLNNIILSFIFLIFAEFLPKTFSKKYSYSYVKASFPIFNFFHKLFYPIVFILSFINNLFLKLFKIKAKNKVKLLSKEDFLYFIKDTQKINPSNKYLYNLLEDATEFSFLKAKNVMIPRKDIVAIAEESSIEEVLAIARTNRFTRFPVYKQNTDNITGILIIYDLLQTKAKFAKDIMKKVYYFPELMDVDNVLLQMQKNRISMAIIVDSFGGTAGLITIEDILEELVGSIEDEYFVKKQNMVSKISSNIFVVQADTKVDYLNEEYEMNISENETYETIAGLIIHKTENIPKIGQVLEINDWKIKILEASLNKIKKVQMEKIR